jgi:hypothetical protein
VLNRQGTLRTHFKPFLVLLKMKRALLSSFLSENLWDALLNIGLQRPQRKTTGDTELTKERWLHGYCTPMVKHG